MEFVLFLWLSIAIAGGCKKSKTTSAPGEPFFPGGPDTTSVVPPNGSDTVSLIPPGVRSYEQVGYSIPLTTNIGGFYEALPPDYDSSDSKKYPLLVFLHGGGERGNGTTDLPDIKRNAVTRLLDRKIFPTSFSVGGEDFSFIIISPQFIDWPRNTDLDQVINYSLKNYKVDAQRIYVCGMSMGGGATWDYSINYNQKLAAIVPICGASWVDTASIKKIGSSNLPVWAFHNLDDSIVTYASTTNRFFTIIKAVNPEYPFKLTLWENGGHDAWTQATNPLYKEEGKNIYEWMLQFKK